MTFILGALAEKFSLVLADKRAGLGNKATLKMADGTTFSLSGANIILDGFEKVAVTDAGEDLVAIAGEANGHASHLATGKSLTAFERDEHIERHLQEKVNYASIVGMPPSVFITQQVAHVFRIEDRFYFTIFSASPLSYSRLTQRNSPTEVKPFVIGSGSEVFTPMLVMPGIAAKWGAVASAPSTVTPEDLRKMLDKFLKVASVVDESVSPEYDTWILELQGKWRKM